MITITEFLSVQRLFYFCLFVPQSHGSRVYACLAITCHLHVRQNDQCIFLLATAVTSGVKLVPKSESAQKITLEKKVLPPHLPGIEPATF